MILNFFLLHSVLAVQTKTLNPLLGAHNMLNSLAQTAENMW